MLGREEEDGKADREREKEEGWGWDGDEPLVPPHACPPSEGATPVQSTCRGRRSGESGDGNALKGDQTTCVGRWKKSTYVVRETAPMAMNPVSFDKKTILKCEGCLAAARIL